MRVAILVFSPSGNTLAVGQTLASALRKNDAEVSLIDATRAEGLTSGGDAAAWLAQHVPPHDLLCVGAPVYARHFQYRALDLIEALPEPGGAWGGLALPFVTYGAIASGIALEEAGERLAASGRTVVGGLKVSAAHCMTGPLLGFVLNEDRPGARERALTRSLAERLVALAPDEAPEALAALRYQDQACRDACAQAPDERQSHAERFPAIRIDDEACTRCGTCATRCPVHHLVVSEQGVTRQRGNACIHCLRCLEGCPSNAIDLAAGGDRFRAFLAGLVEQSAHTEQPASCLYG